MGKEYDDIFAGDAMRIKITPLLLFACHAALAIQVSAERPVSLSVSGALHCVAFSPDGKLLAAASANELFKVWNLENYEVIASLGDTPNSDFGGVAFSPDGS